VAADNPTHVATFKEQSVHLPFVPKNLPSTHDYINPTVEVASIPAN